MKRWLLTHRFLQLRSVFRLSTKQNDKEYQSVREGLLETLLKDAGNDLTHISAFKQSIRRVCRVLRGDKTKFNGNSVCTISVPVDDVGAEVTEVMRRLKKGSSKILQARSIQKTAWTSMRI